MPTYLMQLGHCPDLSYAEILSVNDRRSKPFTSIHRLDDVALVDCSSVEDVQSICEELGGTIRAAEVLFSEKTNQSLSLEILTPEFLLEALISAQVVERLLQKNKRPIYGLSFLGEFWGGTPQRILHSLLHETAALLKSRLREQDASSRFVLPLPQSDTPNLSGAQVEKNNLLEDGMEILLHVHPQKGLHLAATRWLQPYEEFSQRDYGRPGRDSHSGMLPPKLARILINLARTEETTTLLDPFCGSGGLVTEAGIMGMQATGFDNSPKAIQDTLDNWQWLQSHVEGVRGTVRAMAGDARSLHTLCEPQFFDACVSEPYLGPPVNKPLETKRYNALSNELVPLYLRALGEIRTVVKPGARVVFIVPRFRLIGEKPFGSMAIFSELKLQGYTVLDPLSGFQPTRGRTTLIYSRPKQVVQREIFILKA